MATKTTRKAQGGGTIRHRSDGRWEARYTIGLDPNTGKQIQKSVYGKTQKDVRQKLSKVTTELDEGTYFEPAKMTVGQWMEMWLSEYTDDKKYLTVKHYKAQCAAHIKPCLGAVKLADLTPPIIQKFYNDLRRGVNEREPLAPKSVRNVHGILTKALSTAVRVGYLRTNPAALVTLPRVTKKEIKPLTDPQVEAFLKIADEDQYSALSALAVLCMAFGREYVHYKSDMRRLTPDLETPMAAGQGQYGTAHWLEPGRLPQVFTVVRVDRDAPLLRRLVREAEIAREKEEQCGI